MITIGAVAASCTIGRGPAGNDSVQTVHARTSASSLLSEATPKTVATDEALPLAVGFLFEDSVCQSAGMTESQADVGKQITGYCEPWSVRAGGSVVLRASSHSPGHSDLSLVRVICGDPTKAGPGFAEEVVASDLPPNVELADQPLVPGSYSTVDLSGLTASTHLGFELSIQLTLPDEDQSLVVVESTQGAPVMSLTAAGGIPSIRVGDVDVPLRDRPLAKRRWYDVSCLVELASGVLTASISTEPSASPGRDLFELDDEAVTAMVDLTETELSRLVLGGVIEHRQVRGNLDGRIGRPTLTVDDNWLVWNLHEDMGGRTMVDVSPLERHGELHQLPTRGITGPTWDGTEQRWTDAPGQWDAVHFHKDDLYDAGWAETASIELPADLASGIYAFRLTHGEQQDRVPFFVRPGVDAPTNDVALLMSSATYLAYANHRMLFEGADFIGSRTRLRPEHDYVRQHPELGRSMYEEHLDGSGVMFSSRLRPVLNLRPGADGWNFTPDTDINAFLEQTGVGHDIIDDEALHAEGSAVLEPYRVIVTCSHPEYWSTAMLDALANWQRAGGRLMYLGGNGFYWRVAFSDAWPGAMELRRAEDGVRNWQTGDGESYHAFGGEYGGMWRRNGRPPNEVAGVGFAAQGFGRATYFDVNLDSMTSRAAWIWDGVEPDDDRIGTSGLGGGAAGQEIDRYDTRLGSPEHAVVLASATQFGPDMIRTKEEFEGSVDVTLPDPYVRGDIVFYETPGGGAVFSASSISWFGALARNGYDNDIAQMTTNVLRRFVDPAPFVV